MVATQLAHVIPVIGNMNCFVSLIYFTYKHTTPPKNH
jgi:hypothetical protein